MEDDSKDPLKADDSQNRLAAQRRRPAPQRENCHL